MAMNREQREGATKGAPHEAEPHGQSRRRTRPGAASGAETSGAQTNGTEQLIFTLDATTGAVLSIEKVDRDGSRHEVPRDETVALAGKGNLHEIEAALDEAFEAGISSVLEPMGKDEPEDESEEDTELRHLLLMHIIGRNVRRRLQHRLLQRLALSQTLTH
jgi:hypothetical protein